MARDASRGFGTMSGGVRIAPFGSQPRTTHASSIVFFSPRTQCILSFFVKVLFSTPLLLPLRGTRRGRAAPEEHTYTLSTLISCGERVRRETFLSLDFHHPSSAPAALLYLTR